MSSTDEFLDLGPLNYVPSRSISILMMVLFGVSTLLHSGQSIYHKTWWLFPTAVLCGVMEVVGWYGRLWLSSTPTSEPAFQIQICLTIIAPTPLLAATFVIFGEIIRRLGTTYSRLTPKLYTIVFVTADVVSLVVQGVGGGLAATATENGRDPEDGGRIMLGGISFQLAVIIIFSFCAVEYIIRYIKNAPIHAVNFGSDESVNEKHTDRGELTGRLKVMLGGIGFSTLVLFIRAIYRTIELADGWTGRIIRTELYFNVLDGAMIVLAIFTLNFIHPGVFLFTSPAPRKGSA